MLVNLFFLCLSLSLIGLVISFVRGGGFWRLGIISTITSFFDFGSYINGFKFSISFTRLAHNCYDHGFHVLQIV